MEQDHLFRGDEPLTPTALSQSALVLAAHGELGGERDNAATAALVQQLRELEIFGSVYCGFFKTSPHLSDVLFEAGKQWERVFIMPLLIADGFFSRQLLPEAIRASKSPSQITTLPPIGNMPDLHRSVVRQAITVTKELHWHAPHVLVVGHGSRSHATSRNNVLTIATDLIETKAFSSVRAAFLDDEPGLSDVLSDIEQPVLVIPCFWSAGRHANTDLPGAVSLRGGMIHLLAPIGTLPGLSEMIAAAARDEVIRQATQINTDNTRMIDWRAMLDRDEC